MEFRRSVSSQWMSCGGHWKFSRMALVSSHGTRSKAPVQSSCSAYNGEGGLGCVCACVRSNAICSGIIKSCVSPSGVKPTLAGCNILCF